MGCGILLLNKLKGFYRPFNPYGAVDGIRTRDIHLGKVALYH